MKTTLIVLAALMIAGSALAFAGVAEAKPDLPCLVGHSYWSGCVIPCVPPGDPYCGCAPECAPYGPEM